MSTEKNRTQFQFGLESRGDQVLKIERHFCGEHLGERAAFSKRSDENFPDHDRPDTAEQPEQTTDYRIELRKLLEH